MLRPGGTFLFLLNHPLLQTPGSGWIDDQVLDPPEQYWRIGAYLVEGDTEEQVERGVFIRFFHRPLSRYLNAASDMGLQLVRMEEPAPPPGFLARAAEYTEAASIPRLSVPPDRCSTDVAALLVPARADGRGAAQVRRPTVARIGRRAGRGRGRCPPSDHVPRSGRGDQWAVGGGSGDDTVDARG